MYTKIPSWKRVNNFHTSKTSMYENIVVTDNSISQYNSGSPRWTWETIDRLENVVYHLSA